MSVVNLQLDWLVLNKQKQYAESLREALEKKQAALLEAENNRVEVEVAPADYDQLKRDRRDLMEAAARAEERAAMLEEELEAAKSGQAEKVPAAIILSKAINSFFSECDMMPYYPADVQGDAAAILDKVEMLEEWCRRMHGVLDVVTEGKVVIV